jgi:hypothetical protein
VTAGASRVVLLGLLFAWSAAGLGKAAAPAPVARMQPASVAQAFYEAWRLKAPQAARRLGTADAVDTLFGVRWRAMAFEGCAQREEGGFECVFRDARDDLSLAMVLEGGASAGGYNVSELSFSSAE